MIQTIKIRNSNLPAGSQELWLVLKSSEKTHGLLVFNLTGLGSPKATVSGVSGPTYDGVRGYFVRADARHILLTLAVTARGDAEEVSKKKIYDYFPVKGQIKFQVLTDETEVYSWAIVESVEMNQFSKVENAVISLYCPDPYWIYVDEIDTWGYYGPWPGEGHDIPYAGNVPVGGTFVIYCPGPLGDWFTLSNNQTGELFSLDFTSLTGSGDYIDHGDKIIISTKLGQKHINLYTYNTLWKANLISCVDPASDWLKVVFDHNHLTMGADSLGAPNTNRPDPAQLVACIPFNEWYEKQDEVFQVVDDILEWHDGKVFNKIPGDGIPVVTTSGQMYSRARNFIAANETYIYGQDSTPIDIELCPTANFSINFWIKTTTSASTNRVILSAYDGNANNGFEILHANDNKIRFSIKVGGTEYSVASSAVVPTGVWTMYTVMHQVSPGPYLRITTNGGTTISTSCPAAINYYESMWEIGGRFNTGQFWDGRLQMLTLHTTPVLTDAEITWLYRSGWGRKYGEISGTFEVKSTHRAEFQGV